MLYPLGEVLILIFGILIALQVNNWNDERQNNEIEITILKTFKSDLKADMNEWLDYDIPLHDTVMLSIHILLDHMENDLPYHDSLNYHFLTATLNTHFTPRLGAFETLKSTGVNIIRNDSLRDQIISLYTFRFDFKKYLTRHMNALQTYGEESIFNTRFDQAEKFDDYTTAKGWDGAMIPLDFEGLKKDNEYLYFLRTYKNATRFYRDQLHETHHKAVILINKINDELQILEN